MTRAFGAALWGILLLVAIAARAAENPRPCLGRCRLSFGKCYTQTRSEAKRAQCLREYAACSEACHERAGTSER
jgi:hypothetical protein